MRFRLRRLLWLTTVVAVGAWIFGLWSRSIDGVSGNLIAYFLGEDTVWADGYTDEGFRSVSPGMTRGDVRSLLGPPLYTWENYGGAEVVEWWTRSPADTHYRERAVVFHGDTAVKKIGGFWVD